MLRYCLALLCLTAILTAQDAKPPPAESKRLEMYMVDDAPVIDGRMDDACWADAAVTDNFLIFKTAKLPREGTEVRVCYDAEYVYLFFTCQESDMTRLKATRPQDQPDEPVFKDDSIEVFLEPVPPEAGANHFQFAINPLATRFDLAHPSSKWSAGAYTGVWEVATQIGEKAWTAEFAIAFHSLTHPNEFQGTPAPGDTWRANFCRSEQRLPEWSCWAFQRKGFHDRTGFGYLDWKGHPTKKLPALVVENVGDLRLGPSELTGKIVNPGAARQVQIELLYSIGGKEPETALTKTVDLPAGETVELALPYLSEAEGEQRLIVRMTDGEDLLFKGSVPFETPRLGEIIAGAQAVLGAIDQTLPTLPAGERQALQEAAAVIRRDATALNERYQARRGLEPLAWKDLEEGVRSLDTAAADLRVKVSRTLMRVNAKRLDPAAEIGLRIADNFQKIRPADTFLAPSADSAQLTAARNETESFQLVLLGAEQPAEGLKVTATDLSDDAGHTIAAENVRWGAVGIIERPGGKVDGKATWVAEPDPIMMGRSFALEANELRSVWVDVYVPPTMPAGTYRGHVAVVTGDRELAVPVEVRVYNFTLPKENRLRVENWYNPQNVRTYYRQDDLPLDQFEDHARLLSRYRHPCYPFSWQFAPSKILIIEEPDGSLSFDFTELNKYLEISQRYGCRLGNIQMSPLMGWVQALTGTFGRQYFTILNRATGETRTYPNRRTDRILGYEETAYSYLHRELLSALWQNIVDHGWDDMIYSEHEDEPNDPVRFQRYRNMAVLIQELCPGIKTTSWGVHPGDPRGTIGYSNAWGPNVNHLEDKAALRRRQELGEEVWVYSCGPTSRNPQTGWECFDSAMDSPMVENRIAPWVCWQLDLQGLFHFAITGWRGCMLEGYPWNGKHVPEDNQFHNVRLPQIGLGIGMYVWPAPDGQLWPSIRLSAMRDGLEDYEYLATLATKLERLAELDEENAMLTKYRPLLDLAPDLVVNEGHWTHDPAVLTARRQAIAEAIEALNPELYRLSPPIMGVSWEKRRQE